MNTVEFGRVHLHFGAIAENVRCNDVRLADALFTASQHIIPQKIGIVPKACK